MVRLVNQILLIYGKKQFCNILNANTCDSDLKNKFMAKTRKHTIKKQYTDDMTVSGVEIIQLISQLKCGKAAGSDHLCSEYI